MKACTRCGETKPSADFNKRSGSKSGGLQSWCRSCQGESRRQWHQANKERATQSSREWKEKNSERVREAGRTNRLRRSYNITPDDYERLLAAQQGKCGVCGRPSTKTRLVVDHSHKEHRVRGLLHQRCNYLLGLIRDDAAWAEGMAAYLREPPAPAVLGEDHRTPASEPKKRRRPYPKKYSTKAA